MWTFFQIIKLGVRPPGYGPADYPSKSHSFDPFVMPMNDLATFRWLIYPFLYFAPVFSSRVGILDSDVPLILGGHFLRTSSTDRWAFWQACMDVVLRGLSQHLLSNILNLNYNTVSLNSFWVKSSPIVLEETVSSLSGLHWYLHWPPVRTSTLFNIMLAVSMNTTSLLSVPFIGFSTWGIMALFHEEACFCKVRRRYKRTNQDSRTW